MPGIPGTDGTPGSPGGAGAKGDVGEGGDEGPEGPKGKLLNKDSSLSWRLMIYNRRIPNFKEGESLNFPGLRFSR